MAVTVAVGMLLIWPLGKVASWPRPGPRRCERSLQSVTQGLSEPMNQCNLTFAVTV